MDGVGMVVEVMAVAGSMVVGVLYWCWCCRDTLLHDTTAPADLLFAVCARPGGAARVVAVERVFLRVSWELSAKPRQYEFGYES
jgi:hypothetical protein